jgi:ring-1,2-phenylacetyl-CoA epoxidase subunit PaaA
MATRLRLEPLRTDETAELALQHRVRSGFVVEDEGEMTPRYRDVLVNTMHIAADLEIMTLPVYHPALLMAPTLEDKMAVAAAIQDELGHAQVMYRMLEDFGLDTHSLLFERPPKEFRTFFMIEHPLRDYIECCVAMFLGDRAGYTTTRDLEEHCSFGPYARSLRKVNFEEQWHVRHGERWTRFFWNHSAATRRRVQAAVSFYFPLAVMWFGVPDHMKKRTDQIAYKIRGATNDQMRQRWLSEVVPICEDIGIDIPAHFDRATNAYVLDYQNPIMLDEDTRTWSYMTVSWDEKFAQWRKGGKEKVPVLRRMQSEVWGDELW